MLDSLKTYSSLAEQSLFVEGDQTLRNRFRWLQMMEQTSTDVITSVRAFFGQNVSVPASMRWVGKEVVYPDGSGRTGIDTDHENSKLAIAAEYNDNEIMYPSILLGGCSGNIQDLWLSHQKMQAITVSNPRFNPNVAMQDQDEPPELEVGWQIGSKLTWNVVLAVRALKALEVDQVTDQLVYGMVLPIRHDLEINNYVWLPNQGRVTEKITEPRTNKHPLYRRNVAFSLMTEVSDVFYYNTVTVGDIIPNPQASSLTSDT